ncbi:MAG: hypothetical protein V3W43_02445 [Desulfatiglandaceae bacterium]
MKHLVIDINIKLPLDHIAALLSFMGPKVATGSSPWRIFAKDKFKGSDK